VVGGCGWCSDTNTCVDGTAATPQCATKTGQCQTVAPQGFSRQWWPTSNAYSLDMPSPTGFDIISMASSVTNLAFYGESSRTERLSAMFSPGLAGQHMFSVSASGRVRVSLSDQQTGNAVITYDSAIAVSNQNVATVNLRTDRDYYLESIVDTRVGLHTHILFWATPANASDR